jgi:hypothetical protein
MNGPELTPRIVIEGIIITALFVALLFGISPDLARDIIDYVP